MPASRLADGMTARTAMGMPCGKRAGVRDGGAAHRTVHRPRKAPRHEVTVRTRADRRSASKVYRFGEIWLREENVFPNGEDVFPRRENVF